MNCIFLQFQGLIPLGYQLTAILEDADLDLWIKWGLEVESQVQTHIFNVVHHESLVVGEVVFLVFREVAFLGVVESGSIVPKLILNPVASEIVVDEEESFYAIYFIEEECDFSFAEGL